MREQAWPSVEDHDDADVCVYCEARDGEAHQEACPLFLPETIEQQRKQVA